MIPTKQLITDLLQERATWSRLFDLKESRSIFNPLIRLHIRGIKESRHTLKFNPTDYTVELFQIEN